jgi:hypothetical protein
MAASYAERQQEELDHGHSVSYQEPLGQSTGMRSFLLVRQADAIIPDLALDAGLHVEFLQAIPLFESELDYKKAHGTPALLEHWRLHQVPFWNSTRTPNP